MTKEFAFKTANQFSAFIQQVNTLKDLVRCSKCGELVENPLCVSCNHIFCSHCVSIHKNNNNNKCPICKVIITLIPINNHIESLLVWLRKLNNKLKSTFNCDVLSLSNNDEIEIIFNDNLKTDSTSSMCTFDKLLNSDLQNHIKKKSIKKYTKKINNKEKLDSATLSNKCELKQDVFKWLETTKDTFDRLLTQTPYPIDDDSTQGSFNLPSVTQINLKSPTKNHTNRSRSFEIKPKNHNMKLRRHSNQELNDENEVNSRDKEEVVRLLEEEYLDRIEMDLNPKQSNVNVKVNNKSGWKRMKKINKSINKNKGKITELNVTLTSLSDNKENIKRNQNFDEKLIESSEKLINISTKKRKFNNNSFDKSLNNNKFIDGNTQTSFPITSKFDQTEMDQNKKITRETQTDFDIKINKSVQTINFDIKRNFCSIETQTDDLAFDCKIKTQPINYFPSQKINKETPTPQNSTLISLTNPKINSKEECEERIGEMLKTYKNIIHVDSDSDQEEKNYDCDDKNKKKLINKYVKDDLSIEILSENMNSSLSTKTTEDLSLMNCNNVDYDRYLVNIMKKYEKNENINEPSTSKKKSHSQTVYEKCDEMIKNIVNKSTESNNEIKSGDIRVDLEIIKEFNKSFNEQTPPEIQKDKTQNETELPDTLPCTETLMENINIDELERSFVLKENNHSKECEQKNVEENKESCNVVILENILMNEAKGSVIEGDDCMSVQSEDLFTNTDNDDVFDEDIIQDSPKKPTNRVLQRPSLQLKQQLFKQQEIKLPPPIDSPNIISSVNTISFLDETYTPPVDFQDTTAKEKDTTKPLDDANLMINDSHPEDFHATLLPILVHNKEPSPVYEDNDDVIDFCSINYNEFDEPMTMPKNCDKNTGKNNENNEMNFSISESEVLQLLEPPNSQNINSESFQNVITSTQNSLNKIRFQSLEISPIRTEKRKRNSLDLINKSKCSPLNIIISQKSKGSLTESRLLSSRKQKSILSFVKPDKIDKNESILSVGSSPSSLSPSPYVCCTRLNKDQIKLVVALTKKKLIKYSNNFTPNITHIVCATNSENNYIHDHTMKLLKGIAYGKWLVNIKWIEDCLAQNRILPETDYEALDMSGEPGPKISRLRLHEKLLKGFKIYLEPPFLSTSKEEVKELITVLDGEVLTSLQDFFEVDGIRLIIGESNGTQDDYKFEEWSRKYKVFVVDIEWLSRSIGQYKLVSLRPFGLCSDDNIHQLGYPTDLTVEASFSYTQNAGAINT